MNNYYVYLLINSLDGKVFYVGKGHGKRMYDHVKCSLKGKVLHNNYTKYYKIRSIFRKHGKVVYAFFAKDLSEKQALRLEIAKIKVLGRKNLTNLTDGGDGMTGFDFTGRPSPNKGRKLTKEWKRNISRSLIGNKYAAGGKWWIGRKHSEETKRKISLAKKGQPAWNKGLKNPYRGKRRVS